MLSIYGLCSCVLVRDKASLASAQGLKDLKCVEGTAVTEVTDELFTVQCSHSDKGEKTYVIRCGMFPNSCKVFRYQKK